MESKLGEIVLREEERCNNSESRVGYSSRAGEGGGVSGYSSCRRGNIWRSSENTSSPRDKTERIAQFVLKHPIFCLMRFGYMFSVCFWNEENCLTGGGVWAVKTIHWIGFFRYLTHPSPSNTQYTKLLNFNIDLFFWPFMHCSLITN